jgi:serine/threonine protein kinase
MLIAEGIEYRKTAKDISDIINGLLQINPSKRWSATTALNHSFFDDRREYIEECRASCDPRYACQHIYNIVEVPERTWISEYITRLYNDKDSYNWYTHKRMFHAIDLFDRVLRYEKNKKGNKRIKTKEGGHVISNIEAEIYFFCCLHIAITIFGSLTTAIDIVEILPKHLNTKKHLAKIRSTQTMLLSDVFKFKIYRYTIYEAIHGKCKDKELTEMCFYYAINKLTIETKSTKGLQPTDLAQEIIELVEAEQAQ